MTRESQLRQEIQKELKIDESLLEHLLKRIKAKLSDNCPDLTILRLLKHRSEYVEFIVGRFLEEKR